MPINIDDYECDFIDQPKRSKRLKDHQSKNDKWVCARVIYITPDAFQVAYKNRIYECSLKGTLKKQLKQNKDRICCGDMVFFDLEKKVIEKLQQRKTVLMRENPSQKLKKQILATNVDQLLITVAVLEPKLNPYLIDLYIISAQRAGLNPVIVINKLDLLESDKHKEAAKPERVLLQAIKEQYQALNIPVICVSAKTHEGFQELSDVMKNRASVFSGESGVGKSSLINALEKANLKVTEVSQKSSKGVHTTTLSKLLALKMGGWCVDTPGIQSLGFKNLSQIEVRDSFFELIDCNCKYANCLHQKEQGCKIEEAVEKKQAYPLRLQSYYRLLEEIVSN